MFTRKLTFEFPTPSPVSSDRFVCVVWERSGKSRLVVVTLLFARPRVPRGVACGRRECRPVRGGLGGDPVE